MPAATWYTAQVKSISALNANVKSFILIVPELTEFKFKAGQFITFDLPVSEKRIHRWRSYSIANAPDGTNEIELCIVHFDKGLGSSYFFNQIEIGSLLKFKGPEGGFILPDNIDHDLVLICTGTGIAPFRSMLMDILAHQIPHKKIYLIFGTRTAKDLLYYSELLNFESNLSDFEFKLALSRESVLNMPETRFYPGYVHNIYLNNLPTIKPDTHFYLCGWSKMIDEAVAHLFVTMKYPRHQIHYELYG